MNFLDKFLGWIHIKSSIHDRIKRPSFHERDIFWSSLGYNIGDEENGKGDEFTRPILVIRKFNKNMLLAIPLSTKVKPQNPYYVTISLHGKDISAMISQIRVFDSRRLQQKLGTLDTADFDKVQFALRDQVFKNFTPTRENGGVAASADL